jgi:hypothetical protein
LVENFDELIFVLRLVAVHLDTCLLDLLQFSLNGKGSGPKFLAFDSQKLDSVVQVLLSKVILELSDGFMLISESLKSLINLLLEGL